jgi:predicted MPP superfamily phosphohydrolase
VSVSIQHLSDLHRDPENPIRNDVLLTSLENDRRRYAFHESPAIRSPDIIVASGDIVQGVKAGTGDEEPKLRGQYTEAYDFLSRLTDRFLGGDRSRVVLVPGNHDVSDPHFKRSLKKIEILDDRKKELITQLFRPNSRLRWSWQTLELFEIFDQPMYEQRLDAFARFYAQFYAGTRTYPTDPERQVDIFDMPTYNIAFAGFSSCYNNDLYNRHASIHPMCIAHATEKLRQPRFANRTRIGVWHHNTEGIPGAADYLDPDVLQNLIDGGFSLGLHGHQHRPQFIDTRFKYGSEREIKVISAGTLCGSGLVPHGRAYNLIELDTDTLQGRLHVREMQNDNLVDPIWGRRALRTGSISYYEFKYSGPEPVAPGSALTAELVRAQDLFGAGNLREAAGILAPLIESDELARVLLLQCLVRLPDPQALIDTFDPPRGEAEAIHLMDALWELGKRPRMAAVLDMPLVKQSTDPSLLEISRKYRTKLK